MRSPAAESTRHSVAYFHHRFVGLKQLRGANKAPRGQEGRDVLPHEAECRFHPSFARLLKRQMQGDVWHTWEKQMKSLLMLHSGLDLSVVW